jgi:hypothetical protein
MSHAAGLAFAQRLAAMRLQLALREKLVQQ